MIEKHCARCKKTKPIKQFKLRGASAKGYRSYCLVCESEYRKQYQSTKKFSDKQKKKYHSESAAARKKRQERYRSNALQKKFGITVEEYETLLKQQNYVCAFCGKPEKAKSKIGKIRRLCVDHCHKTGRVRGLLCYMCNHTIARLGDDIESAEKLLRYMKGEISKTKH